MKNGNLPASPLPIAANGQEIVSIESWDASTQSNGFTKREAFAMAAMQGLASGNHVRQIDIVKFSVEMADSLLKELEK